MLEKHESSRKSIVRAYLQLGEQKKDAQRHMNSQTEQRYISSTLLVSLSYVCLPSSHFHHFPPFHLKIISE